ILFDIDGTLVKAGGAGARALNHAVEAMTGHKDACASVQLQGATDKANFENAFRVGAGRKPTKKELALLTGKYVARLPHEVRASVKAKKYFKVKGVEKFLRRLAGRKDLLVGLGTGNLKDGAFIKLEPSGLAEHFAFGGYGFDSHHRSVVLRKAVQRAVKLSGAAIKERDVFVIGDTHRDVEAAKEAGYHSGVVLDGFGDRALIMRSGPELVARDFASLKPWLIWLGLARDPRGVRRGTYICPDSPIEHAHYGRTGLDLRDIEVGMKRLRAAKKKAVGK
ncbi:MAG: haloacid dehalogenase-like hydrolase, partial [Elusimicrobia bacterium]|nr:haloacid dehalogenase-like hydrolase [Elusimicrobiota bacterium]